MSARIVVLGPHLDGALRCVEVDSPTAEALLAGGNWRVTLTRYGNELEDATVLVRVRPWSFNKDACEVAWETLMVLCVLSEQSQFRLTTPLRLV